MLWYLLVGGTGLVNFFVHAIMTALFMVGIRHTAAATGHRHFFLRVIALLTVTVLILTCAQVLEILNWTFTYHLLGVITGPDSSLFEFAFENYTALGYGDIVAQPGMRILGPITALNGLLLIGWSAFVIFEVMRTEIQFENTAR
jgi:hypothetical protein